MKKRKSVKCVGVIFSVMAFCLLFNSPVMAEIEEIRIGAPVSLTGVTGAMGKEQKWAYEQAVSDFNKKGGIYIKEVGKKLPVKLIVADDESDPAKAAQAVERLIKVDNVHLLLSSVVGPLNIAIANAAEKYKKFLIITPCWPFLWTPSNYQWSALLFYTASSAAETPFKIWASLPKSERFTRPALLLEDTPDGVGFGKGFEHFAEKYGLTFVLKEPMAVGAKDYSSQVLKMKAKNADALFLFGAPADCITMVRQMKESDANVKYLHGWKGTWASEFASALGKDSDYVLCDGFWSEDFPYPGSKELGERYTKEFSKYSVSVGLMYTIADILLRAVERAESVDSKAVKDEVWSKEFKDTMMGDVKFDDKGLCLTESIAVQWMDQKHHLVYPPVDGGWKLKMMPPWDER